MLRQIDKTSQGPRPSIDTKTSIAAIVQWQPTCNPHTAGRVGTVLRFKAKRNIGVLGGGRTKAWKNSWKKVQQLQTGAAAACNKGRVSLKNVNDKQLYTFFAVAPYIYSCSFLS